MCVVRHKSHTTPLHRNDHTMRIYYYTAIYFLFERMPTEKKKPRKKVVIIANALHAFGGGERWVLETVQRLKSDFEITIVNPASNRLPVRLTNEEMGEKYNLTGIRVVTLSTAGIDAKFVGTGGFTMMVPKSSSIALLKEAVSNSDVVYVVSFNPVILYLTVTYSKQFRKRLVIGLHNPDFLTEAKVGASLAKRAPVLLRNKLQALLIKSIKNIHAQTKTQVLALSRAGYQGNVFYIPHAVSFHPDLSKIAIHDKPFTVLFVARFAKYQKGLDMLESIISSALAKDDSIKFRIIGSGPEGEAIIENIRKAHPKNVKVLGFVPEEKLAAEYENASLFILPSRYETPGLSLLEAQNFGVPAVAFDVPGPKDIIVDGFQGKLVSPFDTEAFADAIVRYKKLYARDKTDYSRLKLRIHKSIEKRYSEDAFIAAFTKMLLEQK